MRRAIFLLLFFCGLQPLRAQFDLPTSSARGLAMGEACVALHDAASAACNVAGASWIDRTFTILSYRQDFFLQSTAHKDLSLIVPTNRTGSLLARYSHYGDLAYNEQYFAAGYAMNANQHISLGITFDYLHTGTSDGHYLPVNLLSGSIGLQIRPSERLTIGAHLFNAAFRHYSSSVSIRMPMRLSAGIAYQPVSALVSTLEVRKNVYRPASLHWGIEYEPVEHWFLRAGIASQPTRYTFGIGYAHQHLQADFAMQAHTLLGLTPQLSLAYSF